MRIEVKTPLPPVIKKNEIGKYTKNPFNTTQNKKKEKKDLNQQIPILKNSVPLRKSAKKYHFTIDAKINQLIETENNLRIKALYNLDLKEIITKKNKDDNVVLLNVGDRIFIFANNGLIFDINN